MPSSSAIMNTSDFDGTVFFENIYKMNPSKVLGIVTSVVGIVAMTPLFYFITWYEKYGSSQHRTLINQLVSTNCWHCIAYNIIGQTMEISLSLFGPFNRWFCYGQVLFKNIINNQLINLLLAMTIVKYLSIFVLKNPTGLNSEFWNTFITLYTLLGNDLNQ